LFSGGTDPLPVLKDAQTQVNAVVAATAQDETERIEKTFPLNPDGRVSVSNVNGSITVTAWDRSEVHLVAVKTADSKERLADVDINIDARPDRITIETDYGNNRNTWRNGGKLNVDYQLSVPRGAVLNEIETVNGTVAVSDFTNMTKVSAVNGTVRASNLRGTANLSTVNGEVAADFERLEPSSRINLSTVNGRVNLTIPSDSNATLKADSLNGNIANDFGLPVHKGQYVGRDLYGKLGSGDVQIKLDSVNGGLTIKRRNDGKPLSPATNMLNQKSEDEDWDNDSDNDSDENVMSEKEKIKMKADIRRANAEARRANVEAMRQAQKEMAKVKPIIKIDTEAIREATKVAVDAQVRVGLEAQRAALAGLRDATFSVPRIETKSESFAVKGTPKVTVDAKGCSVLVRGWDKQEVQYSVTQFSDRRNATPIQVSQDHSDSAVNIKIVNKSSDSQFDSFHTDLTGTRIEIFVPKKSNLKIISDGEIRLDGVSGELEVVGGNEAVNIRDSDGKLTLANQDGLVRVVGFNGDVDARTGAGDVYLEGAFASITGHASDGNFILTLPDGAGAVITANSDVESDGLELQKKNDTTWQLGSGGAKYKFELGDGTVKVRCPLTIASN
jgi:DUF4097 and DUF4098 domain-containing protein YvlB